jgi:hypothetical protein
MSVAVFNYALWIATYPEFTSVTEPLASAQFDTATLFLDNSNCSVVQDVTRRLSLLNMITAHLVKLFVPVAGVAPSGLVGRVSSATEGSVSVSTEYIAAQSNSQAFWNQTPYGALFWAATVGLRSMRYVPGPRPFLGSSASYGRSPWQR